MKRTEYVIADIVHRVFKTKQKSARKRVRDIKQYRPSKEKKKRKKTTPKPNNANDAITVSYYLLYDTSVVLDPDASH